MLLALHALAVLQLTLQGVHHRLLDREDQRLKAAEETGPAGLLGQLQGPALRLRDTPWILEVAPPDGAGQFLHLVKKANIPDHVTSGQRKRIIDTLKRIFPCQVSNPQNVLLFHNLSILSVIYLTSFPKSGAVTIQIL